MPSPGWWKFLGPGAVAPFSAHRWPPPTSGRPGEWVLSDGPISPCRHGLHLCRTGDLPYWLGEELYAVDAEGDLVEGRSFVVATRARLARRLTGWDRDAAVAFCRATLAALRGTAAGVAGDSSAPVAELQGYVSDAARFAQQAEVDAQWASRAATVGLIAATAASRARGVATGWAGERARQAEWLDAHVLPRS